MKGYIRQRTAGDWEITIDTGKDPRTGKRLRHFETIKGAKRDAQRRLAELLVTIEQGSYVKQATRLTVADWLRHWTSGHP